MSGAVPRAGWTLADGHTETAWTTFPALGTRVEVCLPGLPAEHGQAATGRIRREIERIENRLSRFRPDSVIARLNREAGRRPCRVPDEEWRLLWRCARFWQASGGSFDIALGALTDLWRAVGQGQRPPPGVAELDRLRRRSGMQNVVMDHRRRMVVFATPDVRLDLGGIGKGYALARIRRLLIAAGIAAARIDLGGSSVLLHGEAAPGRPWWVQLEAPLTPHRAAGDLHLRDTCVTTSGSTYRRLPADDRVRSHILDPRTGRGVAAGGNVTVISSDPVLGEALTTSLLVRPDTPLRRRAGPRASIFLVAPNETSTR